MPPRSSSLKLPLLAALLVPTLAGAQEWYPGGSSPFGHVKASSGVTGTFAPGIPNAYGLGGIFEPRASILDQVAVGFRVEAAALLGLNSTNPQQISVSVRSVFGGMIKGELALLPGEVRPFVGAGVGWYAVVVLAGGISGTTGFTGNGPGVMPQIGFDLGWLRIAGLYHFLFGEQLGPASFWALELSWRVY